MHITIKERKFSASAEYDIATSQGNFYARKAFLSLTDRLVLRRNNEAGGTLLNITGQFSLFRNRHLFELSDGSTYRFWCEKFWKRVFACEGADGRYRLYEHKRRRYSIFLNDRQIAAFTKNRIAWVKGNEYEMELDADANLLITLAMVLTMNSAEQDTNDTATVTIDFGNLFEDRPFDECWVPR
jgi:hypothetical protein